MTGHVAVSYALIAAITLYALGIALAMALIDVAFGLMMIEGHSELRAASRALRKCVALILACCWPAVAVFIALPLRTPMRRWKASR